MWVDFLRQEDLSQVAEEPGEILAEADCDVLEKKERDSVVLWVKLAASLG